MKFGSPCGRIMNERAGVEEPLGIKFGVDPAGTNFCIQLSYLVRLDIGLNMSKSLGVSCTTFVTGTKTESRELVAEIGVKKASSDACLITGVKLGAGIKLISSGRRG